jgi:hypothetical protein
MTLTATTGTYIHPKNFGQYPNAYLTYQGERHFPEQNTFVFRFNLISEDEKLISSADWTFVGTTPSGNTIQNHGVIILSANTSGATTSDFITETLAGTDYDDPLHQIIKLPVLSYEDITTYFILGGKKDKVMLPAGANPKRLVKWLLLNEVKLNNELLKEQFDW